MSWNIAIYALATITAISMLTGFLATSRLRSKDYLGPLQDYLLASRGLESQSVVQLLLSTSFSLNGMLYQIWLGYTIGIWALLVQGAWACSYFLLAPFVNQIRSANSLHAYIGALFGPRTRVLAGLCSIIGFTVLIGWEFNVGKSVFQGLLGLDAKEQSSEAMVIAFTVFTVFASFLYTVIGGLRGNAFSNLVQNITKLSIFTLMIVLLYKAIDDSPTSLPIQDRFFPSSEQVIANLGIFGLITNLAFSLIWQFVDMSTWQSIIASDKKLDERTTQDTLRKSGLAVLVAPGLVGTALGALIAGTAGVDSGNVMTKLVSFLPLDNPVLLFLIFIALTASIMSMVDGVLLAAAYALVCDVIHRNESLQDIDRDENRAQRLLAILRLFLAIVGIVGTMGVLFLVDGLKISLFHVVYVLIICQLSLAGPILAGFRGYSASHDRMSWSIIAGLVIGTGAFIGSRLLDQEWMLTGAGFFAMIASIGCAWLLKDKRSLS